MANFNGYVLTEAGRELLAKSLSGEKIEFTKMQIGDGVSSTDARSMSSLVNPKKDLNIISIGAEGGQCKLGALLSNKDLQTGFYIKELGVFARGNDNIEKLYAYNTSPNPDFIPPFSSNNIVEIEYVDTLIVDRATNITALIDPSITYITKEIADQTYLNINEKMKWMGTDGYGGLLQDAGTKKVGIAYYDKANKQMVVPTVENSLTYFEGSKFIPISDYQNAKKLENLYKVQKHDVPVHGGGVNFKKYGKVVVVSVEIQRENITFTENSQLINNIPEGFKPNDISLGIESALASNLTNGKQGATRMRIERNSLNVWGCHTGNYNVLKGSLTYFTDN
nr:MAG TPA: tail fiber protein [Caudoviricetes sp.]